MVRGKRGFIKIVEATVAIVIVFAVLLIMIDKGSSDSGDLSYLITPILEEIAQNPDLRMDILIKEATVLTRLKDFVGERIDSSYFGYDVKICELGVVCALDSFPSEARDGNIYSQERVVSTYLENLGDSSKKVKIFLWRK